MSKQCPKLGIYVSQNFRSSHCYQQSALSNEDNSSGPAGIYGREFLRTPPGSSLSLKVALELREHIWG